MLCYGSSSKRVYCLLFSTSTPSSKKGLLLFLGGAKREAQVRPLETETRNPSPSLTHVPLHSIITSHEANLRDLINFILSREAYLGIVQLCQLSRELGFIQLPLLHCHVFIVKGRRICREKRCFCFWIILHGIIALQQIPKLCLVYHSHFLVTMPANNS